MRRVIVLQDYVPSYRLPFFDRVEIALRATDVVFEVAIPSSSGSDGVKYDAAGHDRSWLRRSSFRMSSRTVRPTFGGGVDELKVADLKNADLIVTGLLGSSVVNNRLIFRRLFRSSPRVAVWGHIGSYVAPSHPLDIFVETAHMRMADVVFAYTRGGARVALARRIESEKIFVLNNTTSELGDQMSGERATELLRTRIGAEVDSSKLVCFIGALAPEKRIDFLADVLDELWARGSGIRLVAGGSGAESGRLDRGVARGQVVLLGRVDDADKKALASLSSLIVCPGRVGLLAVDALRMSVPIATLASSMHAPEVEYLTEGTSVYFCEEDSPRAFATMVETLAARPGDNIIEDSSPSIDNMVSQFVSGIHYALR